MKKEIVKCHICGNEEDVSHWSNASDMREREMCFGCNFWQDILEDDKNRQFAVINGSHYVLGPHTDGCFKGFGGRMFTIRFFDGHIEKCDNLWYQGVIPEGYWRERFPDNAEFIPEHTNSADVKDKDLPF